MICSGKSVTKEEFFCSVWAENKNPKNGYGYGTNGKEVMKQFQICIMFGYF